LADFLDKYPGISTEKAGGIMAGKAFRRGGRSALLFGYLATPHMPSR
jgi:hypothetical protein